MATLVDLQLAHGSFKSALIEALQRTALILPETWRWVQYEAAWEIGDVTYNTENRLSSYTITYNGDVVTINVTYSLTTGYVTRIDYVSVEGTVQIDVTYDVNGNLTDTAVTFV